MLRPVRSRLRLVPVILLATHAIVIGPRALAQTIPSVSSPEPVAVADTLASDTVAVSGSGSDSVALDGTAHALVLEAKSATPETLAVEAPVPVPVFLGGREIFRVRAGRGGLSTKERAAAIRTRLTAAVRDAEVSADSVDLVSTPEGVEVRLGKHFLWILLPADLEDESPGELASYLTSLPERTQEGIHKERAGRRPVGVLISALIAIGITVLAGVAFRLLRAAGSRWRTWLVGSLPRFIRGVRVRNFEILSQAQLTGVVGGILGRVDLAAGLVLFYIYLTIVLSLFPWTQGWSWLLLRFAVERLTEIAQGVVEAIPGLVVIIILFFVFRWIVGLSDRFLDSIESGATELPGLHPELARPTKRLLKVFLWIIAAMIAYPYIPGAQTKAVQGVSILLGVMVSLGSTGFVGNVISGIVLTYSRSFRIGDRVKIGDQMGDVVGLGFFATKLRTIRNEEVTLPNGHVASSAIVNFTMLAQERGLVLHTEVTIGYNVDWRRVHELLIEAAGHVEGIEKEPEPRVYQRSLNDYHVSYELTCTTRLSHPQLRLYSDLHQEIQDAFARAGIEILSPGYHAVRDAHAPVLPREPIGPRPEPGAFRIEPKPTESP